MLITCSGEAFPQALGLPLLTLLTEHLGGGKGVQPTAMDTDFVDVAHVQSIKVEKDKMI